MTATEFRTTAKKWLNHKILLSDKSAVWYNEKYRRTAMFHVKSIFSSFLTFPANYNINMLAFQIKKHEDFLLAILPNPQNNAYNSAVVTLQELLKFAGEFLKENNLESLIK